jgi:hypothetical protein
MKLSTVNKKKITQKGGNGGGKEDFVCAAETAGILG